MTIFGQPIINRFVAKHADARAWLATWVDVAREARWQNLMEVRQQYPSTDGVKPSSGEIVTVFNVKGNEYRMISRLDYGQQFVQVLELLTHAEYDKQAWKRRL